MAVEQCKINSAQSVGQEETWRKLFVKHFDTEEVGDQAGDLDFVVGSVGSYWGFVMFLSLYYGPLTPMPFIFVSLNLVSVEDANQLIPKT